MMMTTENSVQENQIRNLNQDQLIRQIFDEARKDEQEMDQTFSLLGWKDLPLELKLTIYSDVQGYLNEIEGNFSTACAYVQTRRERVDYWVSSFQDGICTLKQTVDALKMSV